MEFLGKGSLDSYAAKCAPAGWNANELYRIAIGVSRGMAHLAERGIVHRDLAARNILLSKLCEPKVSDFGMSRVLSEESGSGQTSSTVGPIKWMSPENIGSRTFSEKSDVWAYGVLLYELIVGHEPYLNEELLEIAVSIRDTARTPLPMIPKDVHVPKYLMEVMEMCFKPAPEDRPTFVDIAKLLEKRRPSGYHSEPDENDETGIGVDDNAVKRTKSRKGGKKKTDGPDTGVWNESVEMDEKEAITPRGTSKYGPISGGATPSGSKETFEKQEDAEEV